MYLMNKIKPVSKSAVQKISGCKHCFFFEEGIKSGGIGQTFGLMLYESGFAGKYHLEAIEGYVQQAKVDSSLRKLGLDKEGMINTIEKALK